METKKEIVAAVILTAMVFAGIYSQIKWIWELVGLPLANWRYVVLLLAAGALNYGFIRWIGGGKDDK